MPMLLTIPLLLCAVAGLSAATVPVSDCWAVVHWSVYGSNLYKFNPEETTWSEAERACVLNGGNLASVHSVGEYDFIRDLIQKSAGADSISWIGGCDAVQEGIWLWSDGTKFSYTNWNTGEPNGAGPEGCIHMNWGEQKKWNDKVCSSKYASVCSRRL